MESGRRDRPLPVLHRWLIAGASLLAPPELRAGWRKEWTGEVWHALDSGRNRLGVTLRTAWCFVDAVWLWKREMTMTGWVGDLRIALRSFGKSPGLTTAMVLTLALGIGATSAIFSVVDGVLLRDLPAADAEELVWFSQSLPSRNITGWQYSYAQYRTLAETVQSVDVGVFTMTAFNLMGSNGPARISAARVSDSYLPLLGVKPARGRLFTREEEAAHLKLTLVSHDFWMSEMGGDPSAIGSTLTLDQDAYEVIGVMPAVGLTAELGSAAGFPWDGIDLFIPLEEFGSSQGDLVSTLQMVGRLEGGASVKQARAEVEGVLDEFLAARTVEGWFTEAQSLQEFLVGPSRSPLTILMGAVAVLLILGCMNVSGLLLVRSVARNREWATRRALGAGGTRIVRQLVTEGALLSVAGGALGVGLAYWALEWIRLTSPAGLIRVDELALNGRAVLFSVGLAGLTTLVFGLLPGPSALRRAPAAALAASRQTLSPRGRRGLKALVVAEVALTIVLLTGSAVLLRSLANLLHQDPGFDGTAVLRGTTALSADRHPRDADVLRFVEQVLAQLEARPDVRSVAVSAIPAPTVAPRNRLTIDGRPPEEAGGSAMQHAVSPGYFETLDMSLVEGRGFTGADRMDAPQVAVINEAMAERYWPGESPLGERVRIGSWRNFTRTGGSTPPVSREVVGVVANATDVGLNPGEPVEMIFAPFAQDPWGQHTYLVRTSGDPRDLAPVLRSAVLEADPNQPLFDVVAFMDGQREAIGRERLSALVLAGFAAAALLLSGLGIYGVVAYSVTLRTKEIGIRVAVGADRTSVTGLLFREGLVPVAAGVVGGLGLAFGSVQLLRGLLYQVSPRDPVAFLGAGFLLGGIALASIYVPARRTTKVNPVDALRPE